MPNLYNEANSAIIYTIRDTFGGLSNFSHHPLTIQAGPHCLEFRTSEALYQAMKFPYNKLIQTAILEAANPMDTKRIAVECQNYIRSDWHSHVKVYIMRWVVHHKYLQHKTMADNLFEIAAEKLFVEKSRRDDFWGATPRGNGALVGRNMLGCIWQDVKEHKDYFISHPPILDIVNPLLLGHSVAIYMEPKPMQPEFI